MKKTILSILFGIFTLVLMIGKVNAATTTLSNIDDSNEYFEKIANNGTVTLNLKKDASACLEIQNGENVILNLNGHNLNNVYNELCPTIKVLKGASLTIIGSDSNIISHTAVATDKSVTFPVILNDGTLNVQGGYILVGDKENSPYGIQNNSTGNLTISGGKITIGSAETFGVFNKGGNVKITDGTFIQGADANQPLVFNASGNIEVTDGTFRDTSGNQNTKSIGDTANAKTTIKGGTFEYQNVEEGSVTKQDIKEYLPSGYEIDDRGNVIKPANENEPTTSEENSQNVEENNNVKNPNTSDVIIYSLIAITISAIGLAFAYKKLHN